MHAKTEKKIKYCTYFKLTDKSLGAGKNYLLAYKWTNEF